MISVTERAEQQVGTRRRARKPALYRTVLSIAVAALVAAWLPFSILYVNAVTQHAVAAAKAGSGLPTAAAGGQAAPAPTPVTTRAS